MIEVLAILGAASGVVATVIAGISLYWSRRALILDRPELTLSANLLVNADLKNPIPHLKLEVAAVNTGRRVLRLVTVGIEVPNDILGFSKQNPEFVMSGPSTIWLFNGKPHGKTIEMGEANRQLFVAAPFNPDHVKAMGKSGFVFAEDTTGKIYRTEFLAEALLQGLKMMNTQKDTQPEN